MSGDIPTRPQGLKRSADDAHLDATNSHHTRRRVHHQALASGFGIQSAIPGYGQLHPYPYLLSNYSAAYGHINPTFNGASSDQNLIATARLSEENPEFQEQANEMQSQGGLDWRESVSSERERALDERERILDERERNFNERERKFNERTGNVLRDGDRLEDDTS